MPTRILREGILDSRAVNALSDSAQLFYRCLMSVVDDYGRMEADPEILRPRCFPRQLDRWTIERISEALRECNEMLNDEGSPLVHLYDSGKKRYLEITNFGQRIRNQASRFPEPATARQVIEVIRSSAAERSGTEDLSANGGEPPRPAADCGEPPRPAADCGEARPTRARGRTETESETNAETESDAKADAAVLRGSVAVMRSNRFEEWWRVWSAVKGTNHRIQAAQAYGSVVAAELEPAAFDCTASYLRSLENPAKGYNPDNFLFEQAKDKFSARWPPARASPGRKASVVENVANVIGEQLARGEKPW